MNGFTVTKEEMENLLANNQKTHAYKFKRGENFILVSAIGDLNFESNAISLADVQAMEANPAIGSRIIDLINDGTAFPGVQFSELVSAVQANLNLLPPVEKYHHTSNSAQIRTSGQSVRFNESFPLQQVGKYLVTLDYFWACDNANMDFVGNLFVAGLIVRTHQEEAKDSGGTGPGGTDQQLPATMSFVYENQAPGNLAVAFRFGPSQGSTVKTTVYNHVLTVEKLPS